MIRLITILLLICFQNVAFAQHTGFSKIKYNDSIALFKLFKKFTTAIEKNDKEAFKRISLDLVDCGMCDYLDPRNGDYNFTPIDTFINALFKAILNSQLWKEIKAKRFTLGVMTYDNFYPRSLPNYHKRKLSMYSISYSYKPKDMEEGVAKLFEFVKINNTFKLYGWDSIP